MCNHYRLNARDIQLHKAWNRLNITPIHYEVAADVWPKRPGLIARSEGGATVFDVMTWGVPMTIPGKRPGTTVTKHVTNVRNLTSPFWRSMLKDPSRRCLVPFSQFAEPKPGKDAETGRPAEYWFTVNDMHVAAFGDRLKPGMSMHS